MFSRSYGSRSLQSGGIYFGLFGLLLIYLVPVVLFNGWVLSVLWNWFIPNIFTELPELSIGEAIGISLVISAFLSYGNKDQDNDDIGEVLVMLVMPFVRGLLLLLMGFIVYQLAF